MKLKFGNYLNMKPTKLTESFPASKLVGAELGQDWDRFLSRRIDRKKTGGKRDAADSLFKYLKETFGIELLVSHMQLYGYMYSQEKLSPPVYYWYGEADAVGWYYNKERGQYEYVIVDWKVLDLLNYWKSSWAFGKHLHQCLVYARLLQLHLDLEYLPSILIVAISRNNGQDIHPGLFRDYPRDCKSLLNNELAWSIEQPKPPRNIYSKFPFNPTLKEGVVPEKMPLTELFAKGAKVNDLLKAFDLNGLRVIKETMELEWK